MKELLLEIKNILKGILKKEVNVTVENVNERLSLAYYELANTTATDVLREHAVRLSELWIDILNNNDQRAILEAVNISGTYNSLSKMSILGNKWSKDQQNKLKSLIVKLAEKGKAIYIKFNSQHIANTLNGLSKFDILKKWTEDEQSKIKSLIVKLAEKGNTIDSKEFNSQEIANTLNALSKWDVLDSKVWKGNVAVIIKGKEKQISKVELFKTLIYKLVDQGIQSSKQFNSQEIANTLNALSKFDILDGGKWTENEQNKIKSLIVQLAERGQKPEVLEKFEPQHIANTFNGLSKFDILKKWTKDEQNKIKSLIVQLAERGNKISKQFNSQEIANTLNALSKWDVLNSTIWTGTVQIEKGKEVTEVQLFKDFIVNLAKQGKEISKQFNSQEIANTFDALYKFNILDGEKWTENEQNKIKSLIVQLAKKGQEQKVLENFNSQEIANTFNAFSKLNILGNKWTGNQQKELKSLIVQLAKREGGIEGYNLKDIAEIYSALLKWSDDGWNPDEFKSFAYKLEKQVQAIVQKRNKEDNILDNIRFTSQIITDLPKLKLKNLITSESKMLVPLMECLSTSIYKSEASDLKEDLPKENILSALEGFADIASRLDDKSSLKGEFDDSLIKILKKVNDKIPEITINKLMELEVIKDMEKLTTSGKDRDISNVDQSNEPRTALSGANQSQGLAACLSKLCIS